MRIWKSIAAAAVLVITLTGCASPEFNSKKEQSLKEVTALYDSFDIPGYKLDSDVVKGWWDFEQGSHPNAEFFASPETTNQSPKDICKSVWSYAKILSSTSLTFWPTPGLEADHVVVYCIASTKSRYYGGLKFLGTLPSGVGFVVELGTPEAYSIRVATTLQSGYGDVELDPTLGVTEVDQTVSDYMSGLQKYRNANGIKLFTSAELEKVGLVAKSETAELTPVVDGDGLIRKIHIKYQNYWLDQCWSAAPWDAKDWTVADPGSPYPQYTVESLDELTNFGSLLMSSDCTSKGIG